MNRLIADCLGLRLKFVKMGSIFLPLTCFKNVGKIERFEINDSTNP